MKRDQIVVGATYSDGKKGVRRVLAAGPDFKLYQGQTDEDCLQYVVVAGKRSSHNHGTTPAGEQIMHCTRTSFAAWAKQVLP